MVGGVVLPDLHLAAHLAPDAGVAPVQLAAVVAEGPLREEEEGARTSAGGRGRAGVCVCEGLSERGRTHGDVVALSDVAAQDAGDHAAEVQQGHAAAPAVVRSRLALHAREAEEPAATCGGRRGGTTPELPAPEGRKELGSDRRVQPRFMVNHNNAINCRRD